MVIEALEFRLISSHCKRTKRGCGLRGAGGKWVQSGWFLKWVVRVVLYLWRLSSAGCSRMCARGQRIMCLHWVQVH